MPDSTRLRPAVPDTAAGSVLRSLCFAALLLVMAWMPGLGCAAAPAVENPQPISATSYAAYYKAAVEVLRDEGFTVDRADYRFGTITAQPAGSPTLFEPWRRDNSTASQMGLSTLNDLRRQVTVQLEPTDPVQGAAADAYQMKVQVVLEQRQAPGRYLTGSTRDQALVSEYRTVPAELRQQGFTGDYWVAVERDTQMEQQLMAKILVRALEHDQLPPDDAADL